MKPPIFMNIYYLGKWKYRNSFQVFYFCKAGVFKPFFVTENKNLISFYPATERY
jgi:hypothetical protein